MPAQHRVSQRVSEPNEDSVRAERLGTAAFLGGHAHITPRERSVIHRLIKDQAPWQIGTALQISIHTVRAHIRNIHVKTQTRSLQGLVVWGIAHDSCCVSTRAAESAS